MSLQTLSSEYEVLSGPMIGKILHIGKNLSKEMCWLTSLDCPKYNQGFWCQSQHQENFATFPFFKLENRISSNLIINWFPSLFYKHTVRERLSSQYNKMKSLGFQKSQFLNSLVNWEKSGSTIQAYIQKILIFIFFLNWEKLRSPTTATFKNPKISLLIGTNLKM